MCLKVQRQHICDQLTRPGHNLVMMFCAVLQQRLIPDRCQYQELRERERAYDMLCTPGAEVSLLGKAYRDKVHKPV